MVRQAQDRLSILKGRNWKEERVMGVEYATSRIAKQTSKQTKTYQVFSLFFRSEKYDTMIPLTLEEMSLHFRLIDPSDFTGSEDTSNFM